MGGYSTKHSLNKAKYSTSFTTLCINPLTHGRASGLDRRLMRPSLYTAPIVSIRLRAAPTLDRPGRGSASTAPRNGRNRRTSTATAFARLDT